jgi:hypothetical protein
MTVKTRHEKHSERRHHLLNVEVLVLLASSIATIQFIDRSVVDA